MSNPTNGKNAKGAIRAALSVPYKRLVTLNTKKLAIILRINNTGGNIYEKSIIKKTANRIIQNAFNQEQNLEKIQSMFSSTDLMILAILLTASAG